MGITGESATGILGRKKPIIPSSLLSSICLRCLPDQLEELDKVVGVDGQSYVHSEVDFRRCPDLVRVLLDKAAETETSLIGAHPRV